MLRRSVSQLITIFFRHSADENKNVYDNVHHTQKEKGQRQKRDIEARLTLLQNAADRSDTHEEIIEEEINPLEKELEGRGKKFKPDLNISPIS